jgi:hypothetical protein
MRHLIWVLTVFFIYSPALFAWTEEELKSLPPMDRTPQSNFYVSIDGGKTIKEIKTEHHIVDIMVDPSNEKRLIGITYGGNLIESYDAGGSWKLVRNLDIKCDDHDPCYLFISSKNTIFIYGGYGGKNFFRIGKGKRTITKFKWVELILKTQTGEILISAVETGDDYKHIFASTDDGLTWERYFYGGKDVSGIYVSPRGTIFVCVRDVDGGQVCFRMANSEAEKISLKPWPCLSSLPSGNLFAYGLYGQETKGDYFISYDDGLTWTRLFKPNEIIALMDGELKGTIFINEKDGKLIKYKYKTEYHGSDDYLYFCNVNIEYDDSFNIICHPKGKILKDIEIKWKETYKIKQILYLVTEKGGDRTFFLAHGGKLYRTFDNGQTWEKPIQTGTRITKILVHPRHKEKIYFIGINWPDL